MTALDEVIRLLKKLPGMGEKSATRLAYHLIKTDESYNEALSKAIGTLKERIHPCPICGCYTESEECEFCSSLTKVRTHLCIVEQPQDVISISSSGVYNGLFHVLGGAINPINGIGPDSLSFNELRQRVDSGNFKEIIIATNPTEEGDTTALYIRQIFKDKPELEITRLASDLTIGRELRYAD